MSADDATLIAAEKEYAEMHDAIRAEHHVRSRHISDLWRTPAMIKRSVVAIGVQVLGQFTGINGALVLHNL